MSVIRGIEVDVKIVHLENCDHRHLENSLSAIADAITAYEPAQESLIREFSGFEEIRMRIIKYVEGLTDKFYAFRQECKFLKCLGGSTLLFSIGVILSAIGGTEGPLGFHEGGIIAAIAIFMVAGGILKKQVCEVVEAENLKQLLKEDQEHFERVFPWVQRAVELEIAIEGLMDFSIFHNMMAAFDNDPDLANAIRREKPMNELPEGVKNYISSLPLSEKQKRSLKHLLLAIFRHRGAVKRFKNIFDTFAQVAPFLTKIYPELGDAASYFRDTATSADAVVGLGRTSSPVTTLAATFSLASTEVVAMEISEMLRTGNSVESELEPKTKAAAELMQSELDALKRIYAKMSG